MKTSITKLSGSMGLGLLLMSASSSAAGTPVKWVGVVQEESGYHTPKHDTDHELEFVRQDDSKAFEIVDSPELVKVHSDKDKRLLVEIEGERTSRFLFWGGNLIVKNFKVLNELEAIPHHEAARRSNIDRMSLSDRK